MDTYINKQSQYCIDSMLSTCFHVCFLSDYSALFHSGNSNISCCSVSHLFSYISDYQRCDLWSCTFRVPEFAPFWFTQPLPLPWPFAICCCNLSFPASPTQIMKDWSHHRETEGKENTEREREWESWECTGHRAAVSLTVLCCCQVLLF